jgi:hypothetical protein
MGSEVGEIAWLYDWFEDGELSAIRIFSLISPAVKLSSPAARMRHIGKR